VLLMLAGNLIVLKTRRPLRNGAGDQQQLPGIEAAGFVLELG